MKRGHSTRRQVLAAAPAVALGTFLLDPPAGAEEPAAAAKDPLHAGYPSQDPSLVRETVAVSHGNLDRLRELVEELPELAKAAWDWGFGDWETALGAASHVGRADIARFLIENGARPDIFTAAMLGHLEAVKGLVAASPGIQRLPGPHGITLLAHATAGGEEAAAVAAFLEELGGADERPLDQPLTAGEREAYLGTYVFGDRPEDRFEVVLSRQGLLAIRRSEGTIRFLLNQGSHAFQPSGAPSVRVRFGMEGGRAMTLVIHHRRPIVEAILQPA